MRELRIYTHLPTQEEVAIALQHWTGCPIFTTYDLLDSNIEALYINTGAITAPKLTLHIKGNPYVQWLNNPVYVSNVCSKSLALFYLKDRGVPVCDLAYDFNPILSVKSCHEFIVFNGEIIKANSQGLKLLLHSEVNKLLDLIGHVDEATGLNFYKIQLTSDLEVCNFTPSLKGWDDKEICVLVEYLLEYR